MQTFADYVSASEALQEIRGRNMEAEKEPATVQPEPAAPVQPDYRVGDTLYLDGKAFTIEKVGLFDVELRDPDSVYPIFRSESKENLARILGHEENVHLHNLVVDLNSGKEEAFRAEHEAKHAENYRINSFHRKNRKHWPIMSAGAGWQMPLTQRKLPGQANIRS